MYENRKCTLYLAANGYAPVTINCFMTDTKRSSAGKLGLNYQESAFAAILGHSELIFTGGKDYITPHETALIFDASTDVGYSEMVKALKAAGALTIMSADFKDFGSARMRHWELSCK